ncbi:MAG: alpha/beta fold hydrolase [Bdellovibrionota bacterium]
MNFLLICLLSLSAFAIPERNYDSVWKTQVLAPLDSVPAKVFTNKQGKKVAYRIYIRGAGLPNIVVSPGRTEPMKKYFELVHDLPNANFYMIDHQGQGESDRSLESRDKGYVRRFEDYVSDFTHFMENIVLPETKDEPLYLIAHSMGGAISTRFMETHPEAFDKVAFSAPMYDIFTKPYPKAVAQSISAFLVATGQGAKYAPGRKPYNPAEDTLEASEFSHSLDRIEMNKFLFIDHDLVVGGPTVRWVHEAFRGTKNIHLVGKKLKMPILLMQATEDTTVKPEKHIQFCKLAVNCRIVRMEGAFHEILQEKDSIRNHALGLIRNHLGL